MTHPIIHRELLGTLRTRRALMVQVLLAAALATLVLLRWPSDARVDITGEQAQQVMRVFGYGLLTGLILLAPVFPATSIVREKQQGTLALLLNSPLSSWSIAAGKLVGSLGFVLLLMALSVPAAAACVAMGGIDPVGQLAKLYLVLGMLALMYTTLGLLISSYAQTADSALRMTYGIILLLAVVTLGPYRFLQGSLVLSPAMLAAIDWLRCLSPIPAVQEVYGGGGITAAGLATGGGTAGRFIILAGLSSAIFFVWTATRLNQRIFDQARDAGKVTDDRSAAARAYRRVMYLWFFDPQRRSGLIGPLTNPVMVKEQRCRRFGRGHWMMRMIGGCLIVSLMLMLAGARQSQTWGVRELGGIMVLLQVALILLITPSLASGLISAERESKGWQLLQMTPLSPLTIVAGKLMSVLWTLTLLLLATLPAYVVLIYIDAGQMVVAIKVLISLTLIAALALLLSAAVSSLLTRTAPATATSYTLLVVLCVGTLLFWLAQDAPFSRTTVEAVLMVNPLAAALNLIESPGFADYNLVPINWWIVGGMCLACLGVLIVQTWRLTRPQ